MAAGDTSITIIGNLVADLDAEFSNDSSVRRLDDMLHFHSFEHDQWLILGDTLAHLDGDLDDATRRRRREAISTAFVESSVNEIIAKRMNKRQQMRWNRATVQPFLDVRAAVLNDTLEDAFRYRYPGSRPANDDEAVALVS